MKKRFLASALALCLVFSCLGGAPAYARKPEVLAYDYLITLGAIIPLWGWILHFDEFGYCDLKDDGTTVIFAGVNSSASWSSDFYPFTIYVNEENYVTALKFFDTTPPVLQAFIMEMTQDGVVHEVYNHLSADFKINPSYDAYLLKKWEEKLAIVSDPDGRIDFPFDGTIEINKFGHILYTI